MTNRTIESPSASVSKDAPVSRGYDVFDALDRLADPFWSSTFFSKWLEKMDPTEKRGLRATTAVEYVLGVLDAPEGDDRFRIFADALKKEDEDVIRNVLEFTQDLKDAVENTIQHTRKQEEIENYNKLLKQLEYYKDTVSKPASMMLSDAEQPPEQPPDDGNPLSGFRLFNAIEDEVLRPWRDAEYGKEYMSSIGPGFHTMPNNLDMLNQTALRVYLASLGHIPKEKADRAREELGKYLNDAVEHDPDELRVTFDVLDSMAEALEKAGANATDAKTRSEYEQSKKKLDIYRTLTEPLREKVYPEQPEQPEQPPAEQPEQPPAEQPPIEQPPVEQPEQPPEQPPAGASNRDEWKKASDNVRDEALRHWKVLSEMNEESDKGETLDTVVKAKKVMAYVRKAWNATLGVRKYKGKESPEADEAQRTFDELANDLDGEEDRFVVKYVYKALDRISEGMEELVANATDEGSRKFYEGRKGLWDYARENIAKPAYERRYLESPGERANRLYSIAIERLKIPKERLDAMLADVYESGWDSMFDLIDAVNDVYSAKIREMQGNSPEEDKEERNKAVEEIQVLKREGLRKTERVVDKLYRDIDRSILDDIFGSMNELYNTMRTSKDNDIRVVARSFFEVLTDMQKLSRSHESEARYNEYLDELPKIPAGEMSKDLENLNDDLEYLRSKDDTRRILDRFIPANASDPLRFLVEHYMPPSNDPAAFENWKKTDPILRELAEQLPWGGVDTEHTVNMLASLLQDAQKYYGDTRRATPYGLYLSKLAEAPRRTQKMMENNGFLFEKGEYIKRLREAYSLEGEYRDKELNRILNDMSEDITSIRNLGVSANDPLSRNLKEDMEFFREGADEFKKDLEQLRDAVTRAMNGEAVEPPEWTGFVDWADMLNPNNPLDGTRAYMNLAKRDREADVERHYRKRRKFYPQFEVRDMWNNPRGDPQSIMNRLRKRGIIPGAQPGYSTRQGYTAQPIIGPKDFEELSAMVGPYYYNRTRLDANQPGLYEFSQKALRIASNLAFDMRNEADAKAVRQFEQALEIAGRCRKGAASGGQPGPRRTTERGEANRVGSGHLNYQEARNMYRGALRDI